MATFIAGLAILLVGGALYGRLCERAFGPDDRTTPAIEKADGVDYVPMPKWRNSLINLLNIAGTGPILGPIQGILFGPAAFVTIPIGCVIGGAVHDYFCGMVSMREGGAQMPELVRRCAGKWFHRAYTVFACLVLFLIGVVLMYTPGDIAATQVLGLSGSPSDPATWAIYAVIFGYCLVATVFPIDKIIGRVYPVFGAVLLLSTACMLVMLVAGNYPLVNIWEEWTLGGFDFAAYFSAQNFVPVFFVTVACGILSGFHSTQVTLVTRTVRSEREGRTTFYNMMILEGAVAMVWAAASMAMIGVGAAEGGITMQMTDGGWAYFAQVDGEVQKIAATSVVGVACNKLLGPVGGIVAIIGAIVLSVTSGDTAMRSSYSVGGAGHQGRRRWEAPRRGGAPVRAGGVPARLGEVGRGRFRDHLALLGLGEPDAGRVRARHRDDLARIPRKTAGCMDAARSFGVLRVHYLHVPFICANRL